MQNNTKRNRYIIKVKELGVNMTILKRWYIRKKFRLFHKENVTLRQTTQPQWQCHKLTSYQTGSSSADRKLAVCLLLTESATYFFFANKELMPLTVHTSHHFKDSKRGNSSDYEYHLVPDPLFFSRLYPHVYRIIIQAFFVPKNIWFWNQI